MNSFLVLVFDCFGRLFCGIKLKVDSLIDKLDTLSLSLIGDKFLSSLNVVLASCGITFMLENPFFSITKETLYGRLEYPTLSSTKPGLLLFPLLIFSGLNLA